VRERDTDRNRKKPIETSSLVMMSLLRLIALRVSRFSMVTSSRIIVENLVFQPSVAELRATNRRRL